MELKLKLSIYEGSSILRLFEVRLSESAVIGYSYFDLLCLHHLTWHYSCRTLLWWHHRMFAEWCSVTCHCLQIKPCHKSKQTSFSQPTELDVNANRTVAWSILFTFFFQDSTSGRSHEQKQSPTGHGDRARRCSPWHSACHSYQRLHFCMMRFAICWFSVTHWSKCIYLYIYIHIYIYIVSGKLGYITSRPWSCFFSHCLDHVLPALLEVELKPWRSGA